ncbi:MAG TPA: crosslink repair DNA glycosylase YcaQ family protein [Nocardioidaceae bacterium]|nr:crosslink repair DNA glycosylase YcaQ family protein [Nocardioidaceae bacterium]
MTSSAHRERLTRLQARRVALAAQGFTERRPVAPTARALARVVDRLGLFQIDSINIVARAHYVPLFSRIGAYPPALLDRAYGRAPRRLFEYWAHEASLVRVDLQPALRFRMAETDAAWGNMKRLADEQPGVIKWVLDEVHDRGPLTAREIELDVPKKGRKHWGWNWSTVKIALEWLFYTGEVTSARRNGAFERVYDLPERVLPAHVLDEPTPEPVEAHRKLVRVAARAHGVATEPDLRDYFRLRPAQTKAAITDLVDAGELLPVEVDGWRRPAYLHQDARVPRRVRARSLVSPFDPLVFERSRTEALFDFRYRIEIYVPAAKRIYGYYVLPFLLGDRLVARVDLKADRQRGRLVVKAAHAEKGAPPETATELAAELADLAGWLDIGEVEVHPVGDLAPALTSAIRAV